MIFKLILLVLVITLKSAICSIVIDSMSQRGVYVSDYCPSMKYCPEGTHVMCMYYDQNHVMGPRCNNARNISITPDHAMQLLDVINAVRSKIANGKETGKDGVRLPRGYGIFRLMWDNELATFAQVLANQCVLRHDLCRATKRFPNPGQTAGLVRFTFPDWLPIAKGSGITDVGLSNTKLAYAIVQTLKSWYAQKNSVTVQMVKDYPDWSLTPNAQGGRLFLDMIYGPTTHMGCGMSAYSEYTYYDNQRQHNYNSIQVICNFAGRPLQGEPSYTTDTPLPSLGYTDCGCPPGSVQDEDCLCLAVPPKPERETKECLGPDDGSCDTTLVLLPIITMEDAPPSKLLEKANSIMKEPLQQYLYQQYPNETSIPRSKAMSVFDSIFSPLTQYLPKKAPSQHTPKYSQPVMRAPLSDIVLPTLSPRLPIPAKRLPPKSAVELPLLPSVLTPAEPPPPHPLPLLTPAPSPPPTRPRTTRKPAPPQHQPAADNKIYYEINLRDHETQLPQTHKPLKHLSNVKKSSIFTRVAQFKLPPKKSIYAPFQTAKKDVVPRKNFTNLTKIVNDYLTRRSTGFRKSGISSINKKDYKSIADKIENIIKELTTETILKSAEEKVINFSQFNKPSLSQLNDTKNTDYISQDKLITILESLEREVTRTQLDTTRKQLFENKIRKIYGSVLGSTRGLISHDATKEPEVEATKAMDYTKLDADVIADDDRIFDDVRFGEFHEDKKPEKIPNYDYLDHKMTDITTFNDLDRKLYDEIDQRYNEAQLKLIDDLDRKFNDHLDKKFEELSEPKHKEIRYREMKHNLLNSFEDVKMINHEHYGDEFMYGRRENKLNHRNKDVERRHRLEKSNDHFNYATDFEDHEDLSIERRKYYQEKIDNLQKKLKKARPYKRRNERINERPMRRMRPSRDSLRPRSRPSSKTSTFYMPERARFLHGF